ncbi:hypothetical protein [Pseudomonas putida]|uniref:hypothetical protein n=1 Tax=Pseudomonas putida TaxID=303 RepID=UPI0020C50177|nr:hypothetical protein [Pseudomonas putida]UTL82546.1 hypothetical protein NL778_07000 [Pseudomonas putida]
MPTKQSDQLSASLPMPSAPDMLPNLPGGQPNLLRVDTLLNPLRIDVPKWDGSVPSPENPETLTLLWDDVEVSSKIITAPFEDDEELFLEVPVVHLREGIAQVTYHVVFYNENEDSSAPLSLTIDTTAPALAPDEVLLFPDLAGDAVTEAYLRAHDDRLAAHVPLYEQPYAGDILIWYWDTDPWTADEVDRREVRADEVGGPLLIEFPGELIRQRGDGARYAWYQVQDRAGNLSKEARRVTLAVEAQPLPRLYEWPEIPKARGTGQNVELPLLNLGAAITVKLPDSAQIGPDEPFALQWGEPGLNGSQRFAGQRGIRSFTVPARRVANMSGRVIPVYYEVDVGRDAPLRSGVRTVDVIPLPPSNLPTPTFAGLEGGDFTFGQATPEPDIRINTWVMMHTDQQVTIEVRSGDKRYAVLDAHAITPQEVQQGLGMAGEYKVPRAFLEQLESGDLIFLQAWVSFDQGQSWPETPTFTQVQIRLIRRVVNR